ncbi:MAG TPA: hypothetical protein VGE74_06115 [Gemmata sp.]
MTDEAKHPIRLGPPWEVRAARGGMCHTRKFGSPRALAVNDRVWLVCAHVPGAAEICVNGAPVGAVAAPGPFAADIGARLAPRNEVAFVVASEEPLGGVVLEIRSG